MEFLPLLSIAYWLQPPGIPVVAQADRELVVDQTQQEVELKAKSHTSQKMQ
jgi:hypothetical protein